MQSTLKKILLGLMILSLSSSLLLAETKYGYINKQGKMVIDAKFDDAWVFSQNGLAKVQLNGKWGYINEQGKMVIDAKFDDALGFSQNGLAVVKLNGKYGYINEQGKMVIDAKFDYAASFSQNGLAAVEIEIKKKPIVTMPSGMSLAACSNVIAELEKMSGTSYQYQVSSKYGALKTIGLSAICQNYPLYVQNYIEAGKNIEVLKSFIRRVPASQANHFTTWREGVNKQSAAILYKNIIWNKEFLDPLNGAGVDVAKCLLRDCVQSEEDLIGVNTEHYQLFIKGLVTNDFALSNKMVDASYKKYKSFYDSQFK